MDLLAEYRRAEQYLAAGDPVSAARLLEPICAAEPANSEVRLRLGAVDPRRERAADPGRAGPE